MKLTDVMPTKRRKKFWLHESPVSYIGKEDTWERSNFLADKIEPLEVKSVLEIGCNCGRNLYTLKRKGNYKLTGIELNPGAIELMRHLYQDTYLRTKIIIGDVNEVELPKVDLTFTMAVLEHIKDLSFLNRVWTKYFITMEDERGGKRWWYFKRNYKEIFEALGYRQIEEKNLEGIIDGNFTYRLFTSEKKPKIFLGGDFY